MTDDKDRQNPEPASPRPVARGRALEVAAALVVGACVLWLFWQIGPRPEGARPEEAAPAVAAPETVPVAQPAAPATPPVARRSFPGTLIASGEVDESPEAFVRRLEALYRERGFTEVRWELETGPDQMPKVTTNLETLARSKSPKIFWRLHQPELTLAALGKGADVTSGASPEVEGFFFTVASYTRAGAKWETYSYDISKASPPQLAQFDPNVDFPGADPPGIPRIPGSRRVYLSGAPNGNGAVVAFYTVAAPLEDVWRYYTQAMVDAAWRLDTLPTAQAAQFGSGILCYSQGNRMCTLWMSQETPEEPVSIIVNYR